MKTKLWILIIAGSFFLLARLSVLCLWPWEAEAVQVYSDGKLIATLSLHQEQTFSVESTNGTNTVTVRAGAVAVTAADCPDGYCMQRGFCSGGTQIVCLPNRLVLRFVNTPEIDAISG